MMLLESVRATTFAERVLDALDGPVLTLLPALTDAVLPLVPALPDRLDDGIDVLDLGCGSGRITTVMAQAFPRSRFRGYDLSLHGVRNARTEAALHGTTNARFDVRELSGLDDDEVCDVVTAFGIVARHARPDLVLEGAFRALRPGGAILVQEPEPDAAPGPVRSDAQIVELLAEAGFVGARAQRLHGDPANRYFVAWT